jgi:hypothetical protein
MKIDFVTSRHKLQKILKEIQYAEGKMISYGNMNIQEEITCTKNDKCEDEYK